MRNLFARVHVRSLRHVKVADLGFRFAFGAAASLLAGVVSTVFGPRAGGVFLGFPAILCASLTLIEKRDGRQEASRDVVGATLGAVGLLAFAVVGGGALRRFPMGVALLFALLAWGGVSMATYALVEMVRRGASRSIAKEAGAG